MKNISKKELIITLISLSILILLKYSFYKLDKIYDENMASISSDNIEQMKYSSDATYRPTLSNGSGSFYANSNGWFSPDYPPICIDKVIHKNSNILIYISVGMGDNEPDNIKNLLNNSMILELKDKDGNIVSFNDFDVCKSPNQQESIYIGEVNIVNSPSNSNKSSNTYNLSKDNKAEDINISQITISGNDLNSAEYLLIKNYKTSSNKKNKNLWR